MIYLFKNGKKIAPEAAVSASYFAGEFCNLFESIRTYEGRPFKVREHLARLKESAQTTGLRLPLSIDKMEKQFRSCLAQVPHAEYFIRITLVGNSVLILFAPPKPYDASVYRKGVSVRTVPTLRNPIYAAFPPAKTSDFLNPILGTLDGPAQAHPNGFELMFRSEAGTLQEARISNFFIVKDGVLKTPPASGVLAGVTRQFVIHLAARLGILCEETPLTRYDAYTADEAFLTNTSGEIVPIRRWDMRRVGEKTPGPVTRRLRTIYKETVQNEKASL